MLLALILAPASGRPASEEDQEKSQDTLEEELSTLEEDDFPDLVPADETGGIMDELDFLQDASMVELAARHQQEIGMSPSAITVITREEIEATGATTIADLLRMVPGLEVVHVSPFHYSITGRVIWNFENNTHQVLVDGREYNVEVLGFAPWPFIPVSIEDIERIEVIRGPGSALYGANALAGVISITTRAAGSQSSGQAFVESGEAGNLSTGIRGTIGMGDFSISAGTGADLSNRWLSNPRGHGRTVFKGRLKAEYRWEESEKLLLDFGASGGYGILPTVAGDIDTDFYLISTLLAYRSETLRGHLHYSWASADGTITAPLDFSGVTLARIAQSYLTCYTLDGEVQWTLPLGLDTLMIIAGATSRISVIESADVIDAETFSDPNDPNYHAAGLSFWELRAGAFLHAEFSPTDWVTLTGGLRFDYNTETDVFLSPRLTAVFKPADNHFIRLGVARAFRKPSFWEKRIHVDVTFPETGPFVTTSAQDNFREFMTRVAGNEELENEKIISVEAGYLLQLLDQRLNISLDLFYNVYQDEIEMISRLVEHEIYVFDLDESSYQFENLGRDLHIIGSELVLRMKVTPHLDLLASWTHREVYKGGSWKQDDRNPKNLLTLGGRFSHPSGLLGSLYAHSRSEFMDRNVGNPAGILEPQLIEHLGNFILVFARLGYRWEVSQGELATRFEAGLKMVLPVSLDYSPLFRFREKGGGMTPFGVNYGGDEMTRLVSIYLKGSF